LAALPPDSLDWTRGDTRREVIVPSSGGGSALSEDQHRRNDRTTSGGDDVVVGRRTTRRRTRDNSGDVGTAWSSTSADNESLKTPDSLLTSEPLDDSLFDGELDWIGAL